MSSEPRPSHPRPKAPLRAKVLITTAILAFAASALLLADAGYGSDPHRTFAERRPYDRVKTDIRARLPLVTCIALAGLIALRLGLRSITATTDDSE